MPVREFLSTIPRIAVESSQIAAIGYDTFTKTLAVKFHTGAVYHYANVPPVLYNRFKNAPSVGGFFHAEIKPFEKDFPCTKVEPTDAEVRAGEQKEGA